MRVIESPWAPTFREFIGSARHSVVLVAPFITAAPLRIVQESLHSSCLKRIDILMNFASSSLISRSCDPRALAKFASEVPPTRVFHLPGLHAKVYIADGNRAIVTSVNLTANALYSNTEIGLLVTERHAASDLATYLDGLASLSVQLDADQLNTLSDVAADAALQSEAVTDPTRAEVDQALSRALGVTDEHLRQLRAQRTRSTNSLFAQTIRLSLATGPKSTVDIHAFVQAIHPDICDDSIDRVINGVSFGLRWKHMVRNAQQYLKRQGTIELIDNRWSLL